MLLKSEKTRNFVQELIEEQSNATKRDSLPNRYLLVFIPSHILDLQYNSSLLHLTEQMIRCYPVSQISSNA